MYYILVLLGGDTLSSQMAVKTGNMKAPTPSVKRFSYAGHL